MQESFVLSMTQEKRDGFYVELGSGHPHLGSNTYLLEKEYGWKGLPIDISTETSEIYNSSDRLNSCINADATKFNYTKFFIENNFPSQIDYLQIDIDDHDKSLGLLALIQLPLSSYRFSTITFEHDVLLNYKRAGFRDAQREILSALGYKLVIQHYNEDWWVDPNVVDQSIYEKECWIGNPHISGRK